MGKKLERLEHLREYGIVNLTDGRLVSIACHDVSKEENLTIINDLNKENKEKRDKILRFKNFNKKIGGFYFMIYSNNKALFADIPEIKNEDLPKLLYLASYMDYEDRYGNKVCKVVGGNKKVPMPKREVFGLLRFGNQTKAKNWFLKMESLGLLYIYDDSVELNKKYFTKGKSEIEDKYTRVYVNTVRGLYEGCDLRKHRQIGLILRLLPYMNINSNIICDNPTEISGAKIHKLDRYEIADILDINKDKRNIAKMVRNLLNLKVEFENYELQIFKLVKVYDTNLVEEYFVVNPILAYKGNDYYKLQEILKTYFFDEGDVKIIR